MMSAGSKWFAERNPRGLRRPETNWYLISWTMPRNWASSMGYATSFLASAKVTSSVFCKDLNALRSAG